MSEKNESWQLMSEDGVYETDMESLRQWVVEGRVLPTDKVRKGNLRWIEAGRAPMLRAAFAGEYVAAETAASSPSKESPAAGWQQAQQGATAWQHGQSYAGAGAQEGYDFNQSSASAASPNNDFSSDPFPSEDAFAPEATPGISAVCRNHPESPTKYVCRACNASLCSQCPKVVGKIPLCPLCGELCKLFAEEHLKITQRYEQRSGFGFEDFGRALVYPFKNIFSVLLGAICYAFLLWGGLWGQIVASAVLFGAISKVINRVVAGKIDQKNFGDDSFSFYDDVLIPFFNGIGVTIVTIGPVIVLFLALIFNLFSSLAPNRAALDPTNPPSQEEQLTPEDFGELIDSKDPQKAKEAEKKLEKLHPGKQISDRAEESKAKNASPFGPLSNFIGAPLLIILLLVVALAWAVLYYPIALAIAGYTEDFWSIVNPLVGLDTIRRMGFTYVKAFFMYLSVQAVGWVLTIFAYILLAPFDMPFVGNLPANFIGSMITFYTSTVIACILGLALYKSADRLGIATD
jgi:hypothetical protein